MKRKRSIILYFCLTLLVSASLSAAQSGDSLRLSPAAKYLDLNVRTGVSISRLINTEYPNSFGVYFLIGADVEYPIDRTRSVSGGLAYTVLGGQFTTKAQTHRYHYLQVPLSFIQYFPIGKVDPIVRLNLKAGLTPSILLGTTPSIDTAAPMMLSAVIGAGVDVRLIKDLLFFVRYEKEFGLTAIASAHECYGSYPIVDNHSLLLGLTWRFGL